ncbi:MAG: N-acetyltransferase family protein [Methylocystis sp.]
MTLDKISYRQATLSDVSAIRELQQNNLREVGGTLSASLPSSIIEQMTQDLPAIVAVCDDSVVGYLLMSEPKKTFGQPIIKAMLEAYPIEEGTIIYGPICVSSKLRGKGVAQGLWDELRRTIPKLKCVCFIRQDNTASIHAHTKLGMKEAASFIYNNAEHIVFTYGC